MRVAGARASVHGEEAPAPLESAWRRRRSTRRRWRTPTTAPALRRTCPPRSAQRFAFKHNLYKLREERDIKPSSFGQLVSATLYERRFGPYFCQPVIGARCRPQSTASRPPLRHGGRPSWACGGPPPAALPAHRCPLASSPRPSPAPAAGLESDGTPYLCGMDSIGAMETAKDFMVAGTATDSLLGICESLWRPDLVRRGLGRAKGAPGATPASTPSTHPTHPPPPRAPRSCLRR